MFGCAAHCRYDWLTSRKLLVNAKSRVSYPVLAKPDGVRGNRDWDTIADRGGGFLKLARDR